MVLLGVVCVCVCVCVGGGGCIPQPWPEEVQGWGVLFFMIKQKNIRDKMRYSNLSNNMMISEL
jgi:hypothetical protein